MANGVKHLVICGSPRANGRSAEVAERVVRTLRMEDRHASVTLLRVSDVRIQGCTGCDYCRKDKECLFQDGMEQVLADMDEADVLHVVCPVYFAGPPSRFKALLDRLQPHYWRGTRALPKRPAHLHVVGDGGDPHGYEPLVVICRSALAVAGFQIESVEPHIRKPGSEPPANTAQAPEPKLERETRPEPEVESGGTPKFETGHSSQEEKPSGPWSGEILPFDASRFMRYDADVPDWDVLDEGDA